MIQIACFPEELIIPVVYHITPAHVLRTVRLSRILPTQPDLIPAVLDHYRARTRMTDADNALPYGICFAGSPTVYLTNGHHRWYVCRERGRTHLRMWVHHHPVSILEALRQIFVPSIPATLVEKRHRPAVKVHPQQLQLVWAQ